MSRPKRNHDTRERLLDEGLKTFGHLGYNGAGIKEIVDRAGVPKGSFYNYFESKEHFGVAVIERYTERLLANMDAALAGAGADAVEAIRGYFRRATAAFADAGVDDGCLLCNLGAEMAGQSPLCRDAMKAAVDAQHRRLAAALERGRAAGNVRADATVADLAYALLDGWNGALLRMKNTHSIAPLEWFCESQIDRSIAA